GEGFRKEDHAGVCLADLLDHPFPEGQGLGVRVVDAEDAHAVPHPEQNYVAQRVPEFWYGIPVEMDVDDVLVFLGRVLRKLDGAVRPPVEPLGMLLDPRVVPRTLD